MVICFQLCVRIGEYIDFVGSSFNDVFALFVDRENIALIPALPPVAVNTVNGSTNSAYYRNNVANTNGFGDLLLDSAFDGLTTVITATKLGPLSAGLHSMKFAVADTADGRLDAAVFIQAVAFLTPIRGNIPEPAALALMGIGHSRYRL